MNDTSAERDSPVLAGATGSAIQHHLIDDGWIMRADDEALDHDCNGWWRLDSHHSGKWMIGKPYNRNFFVPIRRAGKRPDPLAEILSPNKADLPSGR